MHLYRDHFQNFKRYNIPKAQLIIADIPYNLGINAYASNPEWYVGGDNKNGESVKAGKAFFDTDENFKVAEFMHFASQMLKKEPKRDKEQKGKRKQEAPCMLVFCAFEQMHFLIQKAKEYGFNHYINLTLVKKSSPGVLKANMRFVENCEYALIFYRNTLPKFNNDGKMLMSGMPFTRDEKDIKKIHPTQKPIKLLEFFIRTLTDVGDVVIDPCAGSGSTIVASENLGRKGYGFEIDRNFHSLAVDFISTQLQRKLF